jgi:hypothetical protein
MLALKARAGGGKWGLAQWIGQVEEDEAVRRYARADLAAFVASRTAITEAPWKLAESVRCHAAAAKEAAFRERLRTIRGEGLTDARREGDRRRWRVRYSDETEGLLILESVVEPPRPAALAELERQQEKWKFDRTLPGARALDRRVAAMRAGLPDPSPPPVPESEKIEIRRPENLAAWRFRPEQPVLFADGTLHGA